MLYQLNYILDMKKIKIALLLYFALMPVLFIALIVLLRA